MKKLLLLAMLLFGTMTFAQETFVRKYTSMMVTIDDVEEAMKDADLTVVFNPNGNKGIKFYYGSGETTEYLQVSDLTEGTTTGGYKYQLIKIINKEKGYELILQLFDNDGVLRLLFSEGNTIEFYQ
jgi:hypothetical protein